jgi:hypothetical protein
MDDMGNPNGGTLRGPLPSQTALTDRERALAEQLLQGIEKRYDPVERRFKLSQHVRLERTDRLAWSCDFDLSFYIDDKEEVSTPRLAVSYSGGDWINFDRLTVRAGDGLFKLKLSQTPTRTTMDVPPLGLLALEIGQLNALDCKDMLEACFCEDEALVRLESPKSWHDFKLSSGNIADLKGMVLVYRYLGGIW